MNKEETLKQICKMISSGEIPDEVYNKYLSKTPIGFMNYEELYDFLMNKKQKEVIDKVRKICSNVPYDWSICGIDVVHKIENILKEVE